MLHGFRGHGDRPGLSSTHEYPINALPILSLLLDGRIIVLQLQVIVHML